MNSGLGDDQRGTTTAIVLVILLMIGMTAAAGLKDRIYYDQMSANLAFKQRSFHAAEAGLERSVDTIADNSDWLLELQLQPLESDWFLCAESQQPSKGPCGPAQFFDVQAELMVTTKTQRLAQTSSVDINGRLVVLNHYMTTSEASYGTIEGFGSRQTLYWRAPDAGLFNSPVWSGIETIAWRNEL